MQTIVLASGNPGKLREFQSLLGNLGYDIRPQSEFAVDNAEETGLTFVENAILKARHACKHTGHAAISDDSGIEVDALKGAPGIYSARFSGEDGDDTANNEKLLRELAGIPNEQRTARYQCVLVYMAHEFDPTPIIAQGSWEGTILEAPVGENGFGYDPLFWVPTHNCSSAQLSKDTKNGMSHRAIAMKKLIDQISCSTTP
ncbi:MAG: RdgB/HAM1 family non-canonical purine NTP pyrophosphatase [Agarilytica sp.]